MKVRMCSAMHPVIVKAEDQEAIMEIRLGLLSIDCGLFTRNSFILLHIYLYRH